MKPLTRREALIAGAAVGAPLLLSPAPASADAAGDALVLTPVVRAEVVAGAVYSAVWASSSGRVRRLAGRFGEHEVEHVQALSTALEALGAPRPVAPGDSAGLDLATRALGIGRLTGQRTSEDLLSFLLAMEERLIGHWIEAHRGLGAMSLVQTATQVLSCQSQHAVVLREALGRRALADPLDAGR